MKKVEFNKKRNSLRGKIFRCILGDECGAVAMEYIVIALLVATAIVGLVIVFSGSLQSMLAQIIGVTQSTDNTQIQSAQAKRDTDKGALSNGLSSAESNAKAIANGQGAEGGTGSSGDGSEGGVCRPGDPFPSDYIFPNNRHKKIHRKPLKLK